MKINEIIQEGVWDKLKTTGQQVRQGVSTVANKVGQGIGTAYNTAVQPQARQQRLANQAAQKFQTKTALGRNWSPQAQQRFQNAGTFMGDLANTINKNTSGSMFTKATQTSTENPIPPGSKVKLDGNIGSSGDKYKGEYIMTNQGWVDNTTKQPIRDAKTIADLNDFWFDRTTDQPQQQQRVSSILGPGGKPIRYDAQDKPIVS